MIKEAGFFASLMGFLVGVTIGMLGGFQLGMKHSKDVIDWTFKSEIASMENVLAKDCQKVIRCNLFYCEDAK